MRIVWAFDVKQAADTEVLQHAMDSRHKASLITQGNEALREDLPRPIPIWGLK